MTTTAKPPTSNLRIAYALLVLLQQQRGGVRHSRSKGAYIWNSNGREVADAKIQKQLDSIVDDFQKNAERLSDRLDSGSLNIAGYQERMRREVKDIHRTQYIAGRGGVDKMTPRDWGRLGSDLRWMQYDRLDKFALEIADGKLSPAQINARSKRYMEAANKQYWRGKTEAKAAAGFISEQRFTNNDDPCKPCEKSRDKGRQPIGTLPKPGEDCEGTTHCRCTMKYYKAGE